jgi:hypothetical protein
MLKPLLHKVTTMPGRYPRSLLWLILLGFVASCGPIPVDSTDSEEESGDETTNTEWAFKITRPDSTWGVTVITDYLYVAPNGLSRVEVWMTHPPQSDDEAGFEATLILLPSAAHDTTAILDLVLDVDNNLVESFAGYAAPGSLSQRIESDVTAHWQFALSDEHEDNFLPGVQFYVRVWLHERKAFLLLGNGSATDFPIDTYLRTASSLTFLD